MSDIITYTDAPAEGYDWPYTTDLGVVGSSDIGLPIRKVSIPEEYHEAQCHRYRCLSSHFAIKEDVYQRISSSPNPDYSDLRAQT